MRQYVPLSDRGSDSPIAGSTLLSALIGADEVQNECGKAWVIGTGQPNLGSPCRSNYRSCQSRIGAEREIALGPVVVFLDVPLELLYAGRRETGLIGDPDGSVLKIVHGIHVGNRLGVDTAVEPRCTVSTSDRGAVVIANGAGHVLVVRRYEDLGSLGQTAGTPARRHGHRDHGHRGEQGNGAANPIRDQAASMGGTSAASAAMARSLWRLIWRDCFPTAPPRRSGRTVDRVRYYDSQ